MNFKNSWQDIVFSIALIVVSVCFLPPIQHWWMMSPFMPSALFLLAMVFILFGVFIWKERSFDERDTAHRHFASRVGYLVGAGVLVLGIIIENWQHRFAPWLILTLLAMIVSKLVARFYADWRQ